MQHNEELFTKVAAPQEAVMDALVIKHLSRLCSQQADQMSANIAQFRHEEYAERLVASMRGEGGQSSPGGSGSCSDSRPSCSSRGPPS